MRKKERRQFIRLKAYHFVKYRPLSEGIEPRIPIIATVRDISGEGVCLRTEEYLPVSTLIELKINFPHIATAVSALAKVIWIRQRDKSRRYEVGMRFVKIEESIGKFIDEQIKGVYKRLKDKKIGLFKSLFKRKGVRKDG